MSYTNADGLYVLTHADQGAVQDKGTALGSARQTLVVSVPDFTAIGSTFGAANIDPNDAVIPAGSVILSATLVMTTAATSGGAATLTIGTYNAAGTAIDADGIDATVALTVIDADGDVVRCDGAQLGVAGYLSADAYVGMIYGTAAYTAGAAELLIEYVKVA
jgi:hypothetical protein